MELYLPAVCFGIAVKEKEPGSRGRAAELLRAQLFEECGLRAPQEDVYFMFVCKVVLGFPASGLEAPGKNGRGPIPGFCQGLLKRPPLQRTTP